MQVGAGGDGSGAGCAAQQGDLPELFPRAHLAQVPAVRTGACLALFDEVKVVAGFAFPDDGVPGLACRKCQLACQVLGDREGERAKKGTWRSSA